ncbi:c-type cytochrome biogenesis protein CcmI [Rhizobium ruizarguesonis]|jgi:cytochrome c-type biogenesis protein CcmH|uniref:c-type cytochrome biogenesis protein CcmI n=1 Tax=Rhizobium ruizarguesonis TaxID=2081791 RepID=UPI0010312517|nr:c-type cytochrome biogenesis protein CcmI [Rhizobium ruizarguesonis]MBY5852155.1 c-type cytochrome biogenesis protein CcmI [Rhizobium leguminosarum]TAT77787.1 c-type cytochrome biogenesis protein CcmI [Rhizobium ruizarguesonis]TAT87655.1 c-type cytochrome biogenesis protein CcmI [Rhizobium ruizarguesonis]TAY78511.1 c-type cytochrome biogenesis protein CcmI [Rhizobium ruizarguesonis]TAZ34024.1 c-type cytochrome biogenesis protein CcmI [Rhizobium ruizarguesonis]
MKARFTYLGDMLFWILVAALTAALAVILLYPLLRGAKAADNIRAGETAVYRDQLRELDRDLDGGLITPEEADYARAEIGRRLIGVSADEPAETPKPARHHRFTEAFVLLLLPVLGLCLYLTTGRPDLPSQPLEARLENPGNDVAVLITKAERHLAEKPDDGKGWDVLAPIYFRTMRVNDAQVAYRNAIRLLGPSPVRLDGLAETLMAVSDGVVTEEARKVLEQSLTLEPDNPRARFYIALGMEQAGRPDEARQAFEALAKQSPADAPWLPLVNQHIAMNGGAPAGTNPAAPGANPAAPGANPAAPGNPTQQDVAAAETMNAGDRQQMIRGMVESLDAKLSEDPNNFEGWMRLVRSYAVLNDKDRAAGALKRGLAAFPPPGEQGRQLLALARELGIATEGATQ